MTAKHTARLRVFHCGVLIGTLAQIDRYRISFEYSHDWLQHGFDIAPRSLAFNESPQLAKEDLFFGLHGIFNDSLPDGWGLLLMDRAFMDKFGWGRAEITPLDRLAYIGSRGMGALEYQPEHLSSSDLDDEVDIGKMADAAHCVLEGRQSDVLSQLRIQGGSPGGARPKVTVALSSSNKKCLSGFKTLPAGYEHWLVKFHSQEDPAEMGIAEKLYAQMAEMALLEMPPTKLIRVSEGKRKVDYFAVRRFDRLGSSEKLHIASMAGLFYANFRTPCLDYKDILHATQFITSDKREVIKAFRLMAFNVMSHNKDDHAKNFSFMGTRDGWRLSPAYDMTYSEGMGSEHTTSVLGSGNPDAKKLLELAMMFRIDNAVEILGQVRGAVSCWVNLCEDARLSSELMGRIGHALLKVDKRFRSIPLVPSSFNGAGSTVAG